MTGWTLDDIPWQAFDPAGVEADLLCLVKAASLVEANAADYRTYLRNVFDGDARFCRAVDNWSVEEERHGAALGRWASLADPAFDFDAALKRFTEAFRIDVAAQSSVRGSRTGELVARCVVETGTSAFYTALAEATREPVLKDICRRIAADEQAHYWMFHNHMRRYQKQEPLGRIGRLRIALGRVAETDDDELAQAYYAANGAGAPYDRRRFSRAYNHRTVACLTPRVVRDAAGMILNAVGVDPRGVTGRAVAALASASLRLRQRRIAPA